ncbi:hypothetical protein KIPB_002121 [Kipferlia bialata]|uniref:SprT-like domain-containing protein n=1 Tax=Kipferlia bialata TaxID=797122 RepID=A0A9K3CRR1_9EUKA|nr:hypothetical protein KIPB_002121 [Kipferlia bialata]|eukprot:g2121.t1
MGRRTVKKVDMESSLHTLFQEYNETYFYNRLGHVTVEWSKRMTLCGGICYYKRRGRDVEIKVRLSLPLLKLRPHTDYVNTLLHEMIHAYLFTLNVIEQEENGHGPRFLAEAARVNKASGANVTVYHNFHGEVDHYRQHVWECKKCGKTLCRAMNRWPSPCHTCRGQWLKIAEPTPKKGKKPAFGKGPTPLPTKSLLEAGGARKVRGREKAEDKAAKAGAGKGRTLGGSAPREAMTPEERQREIERRERERQRREREKALLEQQERERERERQKKKALLDRFVGTGDLIFPHPSHTEGDSDQSGNKGVERERERGREGDRSTEPEREREVDESEDDSPEFDFGEGEIDFGEGEIDSGGLSQYNDCVIDIEEIEGGDGVESAGGEREWEKEIPIPVPSSRAAGRETGRGRERERPTGRKREREREIPSIGLSASTLERERQRDRESLGALLAFGPPPFSPSEREKERERERNKGRPMFAFPPNSGAAFPPTNQGVFPTQPQREGMGGKRGRERERETGPYGGTEATHRVSPSIELSDSVDFSVSDTEMGPSLGVQMREREREREYYAPSPEVMDFTADDFDLSPAPSVKRRPSQGPGWSPSVKPSQLAPPVVRTVPPMPSGHRERERHLPHRHNTMGGGERGRERGRGGLSHSVSTGSLAPPTHAHPGLRHKASFPGSVSHPLVPQRHRRDAGDTRVTNQTPREPTESPAPAPPLGRFAPVGAIYSASNTARRDTPAPKPSPFGGKSRML